MTGVQTCALPIYAFTEDLFYWDNDLNNDTERKLKINTSSQFFVGLPGLDISNKIRPILRKFTDFNFEIDLMVFCLPIYFLNN